MKVQVSAPGKLFLAGEYAVVEAGYPAMIAAMNQYLTVTIETSNSGTVFSSQQGIMIPWERSGEEIMPQSGSSYALIFSAVRVAEAYMRALGQQTAALYALSVDSQLDDSQSGTKYGLGSSGALTVATIKAVLAYHGQEVDAYRLYQLASLSQLQLGMAGSFGDLAASSYGGVIAYHSLDRDWLKGLLEEHTLLEILDMPWKDVKIERLSLPAPLSLLIGWTGQAASTDSLVNQVGQGRSQDEKENSHRDFLQKSKVCLGGIIWACQQGDADRFQAGIAENRRLLQEFAHKMDLNIETLALAKLCQLAEEEGAVAKSSGAGGGDCGIAFASQVQQAEKIHHKWRSAGILPLNLNLADEMK